MPADLCGVKDCSLTLIRHAVEIPLHECERALAQCTHLLRVECKCDFAGSSDYSQPQADLVAGMRTDDERHLLGLTRTGVFL